MQFTNIQRVDGGGAPSGGVAMPAPVLNAMKHARLDDTIPVADRWYDETGVRGAVRDDVHSFKLVPSVAAATKTDLEAGVHAPTTRQYAVTVKIPAECAADWGVADAANKALIDQRVKSVSTALASHREAIKKKSDELAASSRFTK
ncbi:unnamed protein product, partial [Prorocentrum cordatum]